MKCKAVQVGLPSIPGAKAALICNADKQPTQQGI